MFSSEGDDVYIRADGDQRLFYFSRFGEEFFWLLAAETRFAEAVMNVPTDRYLSCSTSASLQCPLAGWKV